MNKKSIIWSIVIIIIIVLAIVIGSRTTFAENSKFSAKMSELVERNDLTASLFGSLFVNCGSGIGGCELKRASCRSDAKDYEENKEDRIKERHVKSIERCETKKEKSLSKATSYRAGCEASESSCLSKAEDKVRVANEKYDTCISKADSKRTQALRKLDETYEKKIDRCDERAQKCESKVIKRCLKEAKK